MLISEADFEEGSEEILYGEIDLERCTQDRLRFNTAMKAPFLPAYTEVSVRSHPKQRETTAADTSDLPFPVRSTKRCDRIQRCHEIRRIQAAGLAQRLKKDTLRSSGDRHQRWSGFDPCPDHCHRKRFEMNQLPESAISWHRDHARLSVQLTVPTAIPPL